MSATATLDPAVFAALGEPNRLRIVEALRDGPLSVGEIVDRLDLRQPQVSKHLRVLDDSRVVDVEVRHRFRIYRLRPERFEAVGAWVHSFEELWEERLDNLGALLGSLGPAGAHVDPPVPDRERPV